MGSGEGSSAWRYDAILKKIFTWGKWIAFVLFCGLLLWAALKLFSKKAPAPPTKNLPSTSVPICECKCEIRGGGGGAEILPSMPFLGPRSLRATSERSERVGARRTITTGGGAVLGGAGAASSADSEESKLLLSPQPESERRSKALDNGTVAAAVRQRSAALEEPGLHHVVASDDDTFGNSFSDHVGATPQSGGASTYSPIQG